MATCVHLLPAPDWPQDAKRLQRKLVAAERKLLFFLSWANEQRQELFDLLAMAVSAELQKHLAALQGSGSSGGANLPGGVGLGQQQQAASLEGTARMAAGPLVEEL